MKVAAHAATLDRIPAETVSLEQASAAALAAAQARDLKMLADALTARQHALDRGEVPTPGVLSSGALTLQLLRDLIVDARCDEARLRQLWNFVAPLPPEPASVDLRG